MSGKNGFIIGTMGALLFLGFLVFSEAGESRAEVAAQKYKRQALEDAKMGWVYVCGWNCKWERIK